MWMRSLCCRVTGGIGPSGLRFLILGLGRTFERRKSGFTNSVVRSVNVHWARVWGQMWWFPKSQVVLNPVIPPVDLLCLTYKVFFCLFNWWPTFKNQGISHELCFSGDLCCKGRCSRNPGLHSHTKSMADQRSICSLVCHSPHCSLLCRPSLLS